MSANHALRVVPPGRDDANGSPDKRPAGQPQPTPSTMVEEGLAATALAMEDHRGVIRHCSQIVQLAPDHFEAWFNLGYARHRIGELKEAEFAYRQAQRLRPDCAQTQVNLGLLRQRQQDSEGAAEAYRHALRLDPSNEVAIWNLALLAEKDESIEEAEALYAQLVELDREHAEGWFRLGMMRLGREDWEGGLSAMETCLRWQPHWLEPELNRAVACLKLGRIDEARESLERVLARDPGSVDALRCMAAVAAASGNWEQASAVRKQLCQLKQNLPELTFNLALALEKQGRPDEALRMYCEALKEKPRFAEALLNLGHMLERQGQREEARECWKRALALNSALAGEYFSARR